MPSIDIVEFIDRRSDGIDIQAIGAAAPGAQIGLYSWVALPGLVSATGISIVGRLPRNFA